MELREKLMTDLQEGHTALMSFQQAIGGSLSRSERVQDVDDEDDDPLPVSRSGSTVIVVPSLEEIRVPPALTQLPSLPTLPSLPSPQTPVSTQFRHINVAQKRKSDLSYSVAGAGLRRKRRRREDTSTIPDTAELLRDFPAEINKEKYLEFYGLSTSSKLSLDQGTFVMEKRLKELGFRVSEKTPGDGSCMFHALLDHIQSNPSIPLYAESHWELRYKIVQQVH